MRTLSSTLTTAQKSSSISGVLVKIVLTQGVNSYTYTQTRIKSLSHSEEPFRQSAEVILDNSDQTFTSLNLRGYKGVISYGITTAAGDEYSACAPLYVVAQQLYSWPGGLQCVLSLAGIPNLLDGDKANDEYIPTDEDIKTVKDLITELVKAVLPARANSTAYILDDLVIASPTNGYTYKCTTAGTTAASAPTWPTTIGNTVTDGTVVWTNQGKELTQFSHATAYTPTFDSEDALIDVFMPKDSFALNINSSRLDAIKQLLEYTNNMMRVEDDEEVHIFVPTTTGTVYNYTYSLVSGEHMFFDKTLRQRLVIPNYIVVKSHPAHLTQYTGYAEDTGSSALIPKRKYVYARLASNAQATSVATALLDRYTLEADIGAAKVIMNVGAEVYDYVKVTDSRENDNRVGNIGSLTRTFRPRTWTLEFHFGSVRGAGGLGTIIPNVDRVKEAIKVEEEGEGGIKVEEEGEGGITWLEQVFNELSALQGETVALWSYIASLNDAIAEVVTEGPQQVKSFLFFNITEPSTPGSGEARLYVDRTTGKLYKKNDDATVLNLENDYPMKIKPAVVRWVLPGWHYEDVVGWTISGGVIYYTPIFVEETTTYIRIGINVSVGVAGTADLRIFNWSSGLPGSLVLNAGTVDTTTNGVKEITISQQLTRGYYFLSIRCSSTPDLSGPDTTKAISSPVTAVATGAGGSISGLCLTVTAAYADPAPAPTGIATALAAVVQLREN